MNRLRLFFFLILVVATGLNVAPATGFAVTPLQATENQNNESGRLTAAQLTAIKQLEGKRIAAIEQVIGSVVAIYDDDRQGGGSGVIIDPSGIALTNHHVIMGSGLSGWGGLADGKLYRWDLIGTDPWRSFKCTVMKNRLTKSFLLRR